MAKICIICGEDCSSEPRFTDDDGRYIHRRCYGHEENLTGQLEQASQIATNHHSLKLWEFVYCTVCDRPLKKHQCRNVVKELVDDNGKRYQRIRLRCVQCGHYITECKKFERFATLLMVVLGLLVFMELKNSVSGLSGSGYEISFYILVGSGALAMWWLFSNSRRNCKAILARWAGKHGVNSSDWPKPNKHWVDLYGNNAGNWPPPSS